MTGTYSDIVEIVAPESAVAGGAVNVAVYIKNIWTDYLHLYCVAVPDSESPFINWLDAWVGPGETYVFNGSFVMPGKDVRINAYSYFEATDGNVYLDDSSSKDVALSVPPTPAISNFTIADYAKV